MPTLINRLSFESCVFAGLGVFARNYLFGCRVSRKDTSPAETLSGMINPPCYFRLNQTPKPLAAIHRVSCNKAKLAFHVINSHLRIGDRAGDYVDLHALTGQQFAPAPRAY